MDNKDLVSVQSAIMKACRDMAEAGACKEDFLKVVGMFWDDAANRALENHTLERRRELEKLINNMK